MVNEVPRTLIVDKSAVFQHGAIERWAAQHGTQVVSTNTRAPVMKGLFERLFKSIVADLRLPKRD
jgi:hypothetical protein